MMKDKYVGKHVWAPDPAWVQGVRDYHWATAMIAAHAPDPALIQEKSCLMLEEGGLRNMLMCQIRPCSEQGQKMTPTEGRAMNSTPSSLPLTRHQSKDQWLGEETRTSLPAVNWQKANPICHWQRSKKTPCTLGPTQIQRIVLLPWKATQDPLLCRRQCTDTRQTDLGCCALDSSPTRRERLFATIWRKGTDKSAVLGFRKRLGWKLRRNVEKNSAVVQASHAVKVMEVHHRRNLKILMH